MSELPEPMVPAGIDLRDFPYMPLDVVRLRDSDLAANPDGEVFRAAVISWCVSWHQIPAASLPDDDALLARLLGYGRDVKGWQRLRAAGALHGWIKCNDGRLYHPVVAEKVTEAWEAKQNQRNRTKKAREKRLSQSLSQTDNSSVTDIVTISKGREGKEEEGNKQVPEDKSSGRLAAPLPAQLPLEANGHRAGNITADKPDWWPKRDCYGRITSEITDKIMFDVGKALLGKSSGGQITRLRKCYRGDMRAVTDLLMQAEEKSNPAEWIAGVLKRAEVDELTLTNHERYPLSEYRERDRLPSELSL